MNFVLSVALICCTLVLSGQNVSFRLESKNVANGKVMTVKADVYYRYGEGKMITHYIFPVDYVIITNRKGEAQVYNTKENTVAIKRAYVFSTDIDVMNLFLSERYADMGLKDMGYQLVNTKNDKGFVVTTWLPLKKADDSKQKIEMAHNSALPAYMAMYDDKGEISKKAYYTNYQMQGQYMAPARITEISYINGKDSVVTRKEYTNFVMNPDPNSGYMNFTIPKDAKVSE